MAASKTQSINSDVQTGTAEFHDELNLAYRLRRGGPQSIIFIHGLGASKNSFDPCFEIPAFEKFTLASVDLPGCGESPSPEGFSYALKDQALMLSGWVDDLGLNQCMIVAHSMGSVIGLYLAEAMGTRLKTFFSLEGHLGPEDTEFSRKIVSLSQEIFERLGLTVFKKWLRENLQKNPSLGLSNYARNLEKASPLALYLSSHSLVRESTEGHLKNRFLALPCRKGYFFGQRSIKPSNVAFLEAHHVPYFIVPESDHFMMDDQPTVFYRMLLDALEDKG